MEFQIAEVVKYGKKVKANVEMDELRRSQCLCLNCALMPDCEIAKAGFDLCLKYDVAYAMTRCPLFEGSG